jgi:hypothetical protein
MIEIDIRDKQRAIEIIAEAIVIVGDNQDDFHRRLCNAATMKFQDFQKSVFDEEVSIDECVAFVHGFTWGLAVAKMLNMEKDIDRID